MRPGARLRSNQHEVTIRQQTRQQTRRVFQKDLLPSEVLNNPRYWAETSSAVVTVSPLAAQSKVLKDNDDVVLIERF